MSARSSLPNGYFESLYRQDADPWRFASSDYERDKYAATSAAIGEVRRQAALEVGCSIGVFTATLAERCDRVLAVDVSETALAAARSRCAERRNVELRRLRIPGQWPQGQKFDLIVFSEVLYFLSASDIDETARRAVASLLPAGRIVLVNWTGPTDYPTGGDEAAERFIARCEVVMNIAAHHRAPQYRIDVLAHAA